MRYSTYSPICTGCQGRNFMVNQEERSDGTYQAVRMCVRCGLIKTINADDPARYDAKT